MNRIKNVTLVLAGCAVALLGLRPASAQTSDPLLNALIKKGVLTEDEAKAIKADINAPTNDDGVAKFVMPRGNPFKLKLGGFIQGNAELGDAASFEGSFTGGPNQIFPRFRLRRARIGVVGEFLDDFDFKLEGDFQQSDGLTTGRSGFSGTDLFINWHKLPEANFKLGQYFAPFGYEMLLPDVGPGPILLTAERSLANIAIVPERQVGAMFWGKPLARIMPEQQDLFSYSIGAFNGNNRNTVLNDNSQFMYAGRIESVPFKGQLFDQPVKWRLGANAFESRDAANVRLSHIGNLQLTPDGSLIPFSTHPSDERVAWGVDQTITVGPFELTAEYFSEKIRSTSSTALIAPTPAVAPFPGLAGISDHFTANGYYVQPSLFVWKKEFQVVAKWESFNPGQAANDKIETITGGLNWYIHKQNVIAMLDYMHTWSQFRHDNPGTGKDEFNEVLLRLELFY